MVEKLQPAGQVSGNGRRELLPARKSNLKSNGPCGTSGAVRDANRHIVTWATTCVSVDIKQRQGNLWASLHSCWGHPVMHEQWSNGEQWLQFDWEGVEGRIREKLRGAGGGKWLGRWHVVPACLSYVQVLSGCVWHPLWGPKVGHDKESQILFGAARTTGGFLCSDPHWAYGGTMKAPICS
jgi:hypothetical protein